MKIKITVEISDTDNNAEESKKVLLLAQEGIIKKYASRLMSAGSIMPSWGYTSYGGMQTTYIDISNVDQSIEVK